MLVAAQQCAPWVEQVSGNVHVAAAGAPTSKAVHLQNLSAQTHPPMLLCSPRPLQLAPPVRPPARLARRAATGWLCLCPWSPPRSHSREPARSTWVSGWFFSGFAWPVHGGRGSGGAAVVVHHGAAPACRHCPAAGAEYHVCGYSGVLPELTSPRLHPTLTAIAPHTHPPPPLHLQPTTLSTSRRRSRRPSSSAACSCAPRSPSSRRRGSRRVPLGGWLAGSELASSGLHPPARPASPHALAACALCAAP